jgi:hypothetical protein
MAFSDMSTKSTQPFVPPFATTMTMSGKCLQHYVDAKEAIEEPVALHKMSELRYHIVSFCAKSPTLQFNGIAVVNRAFNTTWRRQAYQLCQKILLKLAQHGKLQKVDKKCDGLSLQMLVVDMAGWEQPQSSSTYAVNMNIKYKDLETGTLK